MFALLDRSDAAHESAVAGWQKLLESDDRIVTSNYVVTETTALLQRRMGLAAARACHGGITPELDVPWVDDDIHLRSVEIVLAAGRRALSLVDCVSFLLIRRIGIRTAFCFDGHFDKQGFVTRISGQVN